ncbi:MAG: Hsp20/alpha crystallin family protein [Woeseiaceae bacterium]
MNLTRFEPWSIVDLLHHDLDRIATRRFGQTNDDTTVYDWVPAVDIVEEKDRFVVKADVPGVDPEDIDVNMDAGVLSVSGCRQTETKSEDDGVRRVERASGRFVRRFTLPDTADADSITAKSRNGILEVSIPKQPEVQARRITVESA